MKIENQPDEENHNNINFLKLKYSKLKIKKKYQPKIIMKIKLNSTSLSKEYLNRNAELQMELES